MAQRTLPADERILTWLEERPGLAATVREIAEAFGLPARSRPKLRRRLHELVAEGRLVALRGRRFGSARVLGDVVGRYTRHPHGFGFVVPDDPSEIDLYIPIGGAGGALHGDLVAARITDVKPDGRREGTIVRVLERKSKVLVGAFQPTYSGGGVVQPIDAGYGFDILVPKGRTAGARAGEFVSVSLETPPSGAGPARGRVVERLGRPDEPGADVEVLIRKFDLDPRFPEEVLRAAEALPDDPGRWSLEDREDFTGQTVVTIDGASAKDFDDAISVERTRDGGYRLHVHIADVAHFVEEGGPIDAEALRRGTSVYFPDRVIPMLPERLSNHLCSLVPNELRLTQGVTIDFDGEGRARRWRSHDGVIRSQARLTYEEVAAAIEERRPEARRALGKLLPMLEAASELAAKLEAQRARRGAIDFDLPEPELRLALTGGTEDIVARRRTAAHRMIEEFMIAANRAVASDLAARRAPCLFRVHERPDPDRVEKLMRALGGLGYRLDVDPVDATPAHFRVLLEQASGRPEEPFVVRMVLRTMSLARYDPVCLGHFGLALRRYLHFTSPIRRYPDLVAHRALRRLRHRVRERADVAADRRERLPDLARECSRLERDAEAAERESIAWKVAAFMAERLGEEFEGRIVEVAPHGLTVLIPQPFVEGLLPVRRLGDEYFRYDARRLRMIGSKTGRVFRIGQVVRVRVDRVDLLRHLVDFSLVGAETGPGGGRRRSGRGTAARRGRGRAGRRGR
ncbi:MAG: ribonuclease R [Acidobacteria bacterium]|nr:MAG: ribonuclease R [Acidobacteriota bacterium]